MYSDTSACVRINGHYTDNLATTCRVWQGDCLSPTLFDFYLNDLVEDTKQDNNGVNFDILLYVDDIVLGLIGDSKISLQNRQVVPEVAHECEH